MRNSAILGYARPLTIPDVLAVASRLRGDDFSGLTSRAQFDQSIRAAPPCDWPRDSTGQCVGGDSLRESCGPLASRRLTRIAIDATWTALSGGSSYVASQEVQRQLERWRPDASTFVLDEFERALDSIPLWFASFGTSVIEYVTDVAVHRVELRLHGGF